MSDKIAILNKYNSWNSELSAIGFIRQQYLNKMKAFIGNNLIKVLVGQRRSGKSYLLRQTISMLIQAGINSKNILYINKEYTDFDFIETYNDLVNLINEYLSEIKPEGKIYLFIDEVQDIEMWEKAINSYSQNFTQNFEIFITGSNSNLLSGELASLLSGRYIKFTVYPYSYPEYISIINVAKSKASFTEYMETGGLPELFNLPLQETKLHYVSSVKDTIMLGDIVKRYTIKDVRLLEDIFSYLINNSSNLLSIGNIITYFKSKNRKTNYETISNYIDYLMQSFLIHQAERYSIKGKEIISGTNKYYSNDLAFKNYIYPGFSYGLGYKLENIIYIYLLACDYKVYVGYERNKEIDFVAIKGDKKLYVQVSYILVDESTVKREYSGLESISDNYPKYLVSLDDVKLASRNGIEHVLAWEFHDLIR